ncbi:hypothetical protein LguiA_024378 [Lonicera macranthoides]
MSKVKDSPIALSNDMLRKPCISSHRNKNTKLKGKGKGKDFYLNCLLINCPIQRAT